ncbi:MAG TPA: hypothetical protein VEK06_01115 [Myxococcota bacterium]|nr:hypothetical protein [Myxococcota bacterium]
MYQEKNHARNVISAQDLNIEEQSQPVLLETGPHDEAVRYLATYRPVSYAGEYLVYVAESSLLLDLVRFRRQVNVIASFSAERCYAGILSPTKVQGLLNQCALALTLTKRENCSPLEGERHCPIT